MTKSSLLHLIVLLTGLTASWGLGCGDDDSSSPADAGLTGGGGSADVGGRANVGGTIGGRGNAFVEEIYDCDSEDQMSCDFVTCLTQSIFDLQAFACNSPQAPASCGEFEACFLTYTSCANRACPPGETLDPTSASGLQTCSEAFDSCTDGLGGD